VSADQNFIGRWARRKRAGVKSASGQPKPKDTAKGDGPEAAVALLSPEETRSLADPENLPPIETIGPASDMRPFLANGVPVELMRTALRRAWSSDPAIRDFVGLSENSWDFNAPGGVPGFGSLTMEDARRLLARVTEETPAGASSSAVAERPTDEPREPATDGGSPLPQRDDANIAARHEKNAHEPGCLAPRRRHGGALPD
jgi:hypothetical protein